MALGEVQRQDQQWPPDLDHLDPERIDLFEGLQDTRAACSVPTDE